MFKVRRGWLSGNAILQVSNDGGWIDANVMPDLEAGFHIVSLVYMREIEEELWLLRGELNSIKETRSRASKQGHATKTAKKNAPVLTSYVDRSIYTTREQTA